jgi:hypothetical protein
MLKFRVRLPQRRNASLNVLPGYDTTDTGSSNKKGVDSGPSPGMNECVRVVVHAVRKEIPDHPMLEPNEHDENQERDPVLVQRQERDQHKVLKVHLDIATREMYQQTRCGGETQTDESSPNSTAAFAHISQQSERCNDQPG